MILSSIHAPHSPRLYTPLHIGRGWGWVCLLFLFAIPSFAQEEEPFVQKTSTNMIGVGRSELLDTYLSPEKYHGTEIRYAFHSNKPLRWGKYLTQTMIHQGYFANTHNRADNNDELAGGYNFQYHVRYNWRPAQGLLVAAGGGPDLNIGYVYNTRNTNNPAQLKASLNLAPSAMVRYDLPTRHFTFRFGYEVMTPLIGVMFSPNYGQSYYEIFNEGNKDHNVIFTTIAKTPSLRQMLSVDIRHRRWSKTWIRLGYLGDYQQARVNHLKYHDYSHLFILGVTKGF